MLRKQPVMAIALSVALVFVAGYVLLTRSSDDGSDAIPSPTPPVEAAVTTVPSFTGTDEPLRLAAQTVASGSGTIVLDALMPIGYKLNDAAPFTVVWSKNDVVTMPEENLEFKEITPALPLNFTANFSEGETELSLDLTIYWCEAINYSLCFVDRKTVIIPVTVEEGAEGSTIEVAYDLIPPSGF